jgi:glycosyltransferase involved in cell wall biosynthesis
VGSVLPPAGSAEIDSDAYPGVHENMSITIATLMAVYGGDEPLSLGRAMDSVLDQVFTEEVVSRLYLAIDGPLTTDLEQVIAERLPRLHRVVRIENNRGLAHALNQLIACLEDEVFVFRMDSDDTSERRRYQAQLDLMREDPTLDILGTDIVEVDVDTGLERHVSFAKDHADALRNICWRVPVAHPTVCFRRRALEIAGTYPESGTNEDVALWFNCVRAGLRFGNVHRPLLRFSVGRGFWNRRGLRKAFSELRCYTQGIWRLYGVTWRYVLPLTRFGLRLAPSWISRWAYGQSSLRSSGVFR